MYTLSLKTGTVTRDSDSLVIAPVTSDTLPQEYLDYVSWINSGNKPTILQDNAGLYIPQSVSPAQIRLALNQQGLRAAVDTYIASAHQNDKDRWEYATSIDRYDPLVLEVAIALNKTEQELDELFLLASTF